MSELNEEQKRLIKKHILTKNEDKFIVQKVEMDIFYTISNIPLLRLKNYSIYFTIIIVFVFLENLKNIKKLFQIKNSKRLHNHKNG